MVVNSCHDVFDVQSHLMTDISVVLVSPKHAANIGSVCRAAENFEVSSLFIVDPRCDPYEGEAYKLACNSSLMRSLTVVPRLEDALTDGTASIGFTRRAGNTRLVHASLHHLLQSFPHLLTASNMPVDSRLEPGSSDHDSDEAQDIAHDSGSSTNSIATSDTAQDLHSCRGSDSPNSSTQRSSNQASSSSNIDIHNSSTIDSTQSSERDLPAHRQQTTALVFGREESGLTEAELALCMHSCSIPTGSIQPSLNLSHAVCVILAQIFQHRLLGNTGLPASPVQSRLKQHQPASNTDVAVLLQRWTGLAAAAGLGLELSVGGTGSHGRKRRTAGHIQAVLSRAQVTQQELRALHGLCSALLTKVESIK